MVQLLVCLILFGAVFLGKGLFPQKLAQVREDVLGLISSDFNFRGALNGLGEALAGGDSVLSDLGAFCVEVFGASSQPEQTGLEHTDVPQPGRALAAELRFLSGRPTADARTEHYAGLKKLGLELPVHEEQPAEMLEEAPAVPAAGTVVLEADYDGMEPPQNYTMDRLSLGGIETTAPIAGRLNSGYGYRDHPVDGRYQFHGGVDISGRMGDPIAAFAAGTVEYTGKDESYGLYLQVDHGNGVKSFYAHCSEILVTKGQSVALGETIALVGATGNVTGPHLHFEMKYQKMHMDPAYYVSFTEG